MRIYFSLLIFWMATFVQAQEALRLGQSDYDGIIGGHEYVNLGLPSGTLWATCNIGTSSPYETGPYFAWGEVTPRKDFSWESYEFYKGYVKDPEKGVWFDTEDIGSDISGTKYDAAKQIWGNGWRMPNEKERYELRMLCWSKWTVENGVNGVRIYGPNEHSKFLPACGYGDWYGVPSRRVGFEGGYWVGVEDTESTYLGFPIDPSSKAKFFLVDSGGLQSGGVAKAGGKNIRAVINPRDVETGVKAYDEECNSPDIRYSNGIVYVDKLLSKCVLTLHDSSGKMVFSDEVDDNFYRLPRLPKGVYIISLTFEGSNLITKKLMIDW